ncbi:MAG TPA: 1-(5-phosphoribosyl)-5-[(5-phosphoribosylamino)methylideneamino]imidazole-4-carboxamide isomerase [Anaerohalosphaeraceae bacterium]|nr:1-(5-phosphoribosyl)-5-[(5-phosphoribosylamino)methylideneamino]imidazole-4-carboxamide isomerase [Anaerohalosphaeraceae bacterium]
MDILPAIDLRGGKCVRLIQGRYDNQITYRENPLEQAEEFFAQGARWLHIVDLDGAKEGRPLHTDVVRQILSRLPMKVELGGGLRDEESIRQMLDLGLERVIIGTSAVSNFDWFSKMVHLFPKRLALGLDARGFRVASEGWLKETGGNLLDFARRASQLPIAAIIYTDIEKDGMLSGPNLARTEELVKAVTVPIVAAGGVTTIQDIKNLKKIGVSGIIIGRALYERTLTIGEALKETKQ